MPPAAFSSTSYTPDKLVVSLDDCVSRKGTLVSGQGAVLRGTLVGVITASGKYAVSLTASSDGSQVPDAIVAQDADATSGDVDLLVYKRGKFNDAAVIYGTGQSAAAVLETLRGKGIDLIKVQPA